MPLYQKLGKRDRELTPLLQSFVFNLAPGSQNALRMRGRNRLSIAPCRTSNTNSRYLHPDPTRCSSQDDASLHSSQLYDESFHPGWESEKRCASHRPTHYTKPLWCSLHQPGHCCELQVHRYLLDKP